MPFSTGLISSPAPATGFLTGTVLSSNFLNLVGGNINALLQGTVSVAGLVVDGTGAATVASPSGCLKFSSRLISSGASPAVGTAGSGAGTGPTVTMTGNDCAGTIQIITGTGPASSATVLTVKLSSGASRSVIPTVALTPGNPAAAALSGTGAVYETGSGTDWAIVSGSTALAASTTYVWHFIAVDMG